MTVRFIENTPYEKRPGKIFAQGKEYVLDNAFAKDLIKQGCCVAVKPVTLQDLTTPAVKPVTKKTKKK